MEKDVQVDTKLIRNWVKALRSGKYKQTTGILIEGTRASGYSYCCLGVLCRVAKVPYDVGGGAFIINGEARDGTLNSDAAFARRVGLSAPRQAKLVDLNDTKGYSFKQIADYIEEEMLPIKKKKKKKVGAKKKVTKKPKAKKSGTQKAIGTKLSAQKATVKFAKKPKAKK